MKAQGVSPRPAAPKAKPARRQRSSASASGNGGKVTAKAKETLATHLQSDHRSLARKMRILRDELDRGDGTEAILAAQVSLLADLRSHFKVEEGTIFPLLVRTSGGGASEAVEFLSREHEAIVSALEAFGVAVVKGKRASAAFERLLGLHVPHRAREERMLYPLSQMLCPPELLETVKKKVRARTTGR